MNFNYQEVALEYELALRVAVAQFENMRQEMSRLGRNPVKSIEYRLKKEKSIVEKCERKKIPLDGEAIKRRIHDIGGIRVVCPFLDDVYTAFEGVRKMPNLMIMEIQDYIKEPKDNGYRSLHVILSVPISLIDGPKLVPIEVQIRTVAMDMWASVEHVIKYKNSDPDPQAAARLAETAERLRQLEDDIIALRDYNKNTTST